MSRYISRRLRSSSSGGACISSSSSSSSSEPAETTGAAESPFALTAGADARTGAEANEGAAGAASSLAAAPPLTRLAGEDSEKLVSPSTASVRWRFAEGGETGSSDAIFKCCLRDVNGAATETVLPLQVVQLLPSFGHDAR